MSFADLQGPLVRPQTGCELSLGVTDLRSSPCARQQLRRRGLEVAISFPQSFLMFYPTVLRVALLAGFWLGVVSTLLAVLTTIYLNMKSPGPWFVDAETERVGMALFAFAGVAISWLADSLGQRAHRLPEFERVVEGLEEMIVVVDRNYKYLIADHAFLEYRGMKKEEVVGRHAAEVLGPGLFESTVRRNLEMEREHILRVLRETNGVVSGDDGAASRLGLTRTTLQSIIKRLGIQPHEYRGRATGMFGRQ